MLINVDPVSGAEQTILGLWLRHFSFLSVKWDAGAACPVRKQQSDKKE